MEINQFVGSYNHGRLFLVESIHNALQSIRATVYIVAVQLDGKTAAPRTANGIVPTAADAQVFAFGDEVNHLRAVLELFYGGLCAVGRVVVDDDDVEREIRFLFQYAADGIGNGPFPVADGNDDRCFMVEVSGAEVHGLNAVGVNPCAYFLEMFGAGLLHFYLYGAVVRIDVVKLFFPALAEIQFLYGIQQLIQVKQLALAAGEQAQLVDSSMQVLCGLAVRKGLQRVCPKQDEWAEVEVVPQASLLIFNDRVGRMAVIYHVIVVGVQPCRMGVPCRLDKAVQRPCLQANVDGLGTQERVWSLRCCGNVQ